MSDEAREEPRCPVCGSPVASVTVIGPDEAIVDPCGHQIPPQALNERGNSSG